jgi:hypothetical protein
MWNGNGKTFPLSPSTENNLKAVYIKGQTTTHLKYQNNIKLIEHAKPSSGGSGGGSKSSSKCADRIAIDMELLMHKKCIAHHSA